MADALRRYRTIWLSDLHLGTRDSQADAVLDLLRRCDCETLYLVGDIVDGWALRRGWHWPQTHNDVVQKVLRKARKGTRVVYIPGNHDSFARQFTGLEFGGIAIRERAEHVTADGRVLLVLHGDEFDGVVRHARWLSHLGSVAYTLLLRLNRPVHRIRRALDLPYWSLSAYLKMKAKRAVQVVADFEGAVVEAARRAEADGVVCGHIHCAEDRTMDGVRYLNCGDWVESCTVLVEHVDGRLELLRWRVAADAAVPVAPPNASTTPNAAATPDADATGVRHGDGAAVELPIAALRRIATLPGPRTREATARGWLTRPPLPHD